MMVTEANLNYEGSITIDQTVGCSTLITVKVQVLNITNGSRLETYTIPGERGSRICCMNGAAARLTQVGDRVIIISYAEMTPEEAKSYRPRTVVVDENNNPKSILDYSQPETTFDLITGLETK